MDFIDALRNFGTRATKMKDVVATEEATKASLVMPFFQLLGCDIFNPMEFVPEFTADVGVKKGEKVDYVCIQFLKALLDFERNQRLFVQNGCVKLRNSTHSLCHCYKQRARYFN